MLLFRARLSREEVVVLPYIFLRKTRILYHGRTIFKRPDIVYNANIMIINCASSVALCRSRCNFLFHYFGFLFFSLPRVMVNNN